MRRGLRRWGRILAGLPGLALLILSPAQAFAHWHGHSGVRVFVGSGFGHGFRHHGFHSLHRFHHHAFVGHPHVFGHHGFKPHGFVGHPGVWIPGRWQWTGATWVWAPGYWWR